MHGGGGGMQALSQVHGGWRQDPALAHGGGPQGLTGWRGCGGQGLAGMRDSVEKHEVRGGGGGCCCAEPLEKTAAKAREPLESDRAVKTSEPGQPLHGWAASAHGPSLSPWSGSDAHWPGQRRSWLAPWRPRCLRTRSADLGPSRAPQVAALRGGSGRPAAQDAHSPAHSLWRVALGPPQWTKWRRRRPWRRRRHLLCHRARRHHLTETGRSGPWGRRHRHHGFWPRGCRQGQRGPGSLALRAPHPAVASVPSRSSNGWP